MEDIQESLSIHMLDEESTLAAFVPRPTPISEAVRTHLANLPRPPSSEESMLDNEKLLNYMQNLQLRTQLQDALIRQGISEEQIYGNRQPQFASEPPPAEPKWLAKLNLHHSLIHNLSSRLQQDIGKA